MLANACRLMPANIDIKGFTAQRAAAEILRSIFNF